MTRPGQRPPYFLARHFFDGLFDLGFLSEAGTMSFTRMIVGACGALLSLGLVLVRVYAFKYANLNGFDTPEPYRRAVLGDHAFFMGLTMWIVAVATTFVAHALFPDETDFRVLTALPIARIRVFGAKLLALAAFIGLFVAAAETTLAAPFLLTSISRWAPGLFPARAFAYALASLLALAFIVLAITAVQGLIVLFAPCGRGSAVAAAVRSATLCGLVLSLPFIFLMPALAALFTARPGWLWFIPPVWFAGLEHWLLGDTRPQIAQLAQLAVAATALAGAVAVGSYAVLYRSFDRLVLKPSPRRGLRAFLDRWTWRLPPERRRSPVFTAIRSFTLRTLRRSVMHQGIVVVLTAMGAGLVVNSFILSDVIGALSRAAVVRPRAITSVIWAPFPLMYIAARAVRLALSVPMEIRANWAFRMTERADARPAQIESAVHVVLLLGVLAPVLLILPLQWRLLGAASVPLLTTTCLYGWLYVELLMRTWCRIPFTSSYVPGKTFVPQAVIVGGASFVAFTSVGPALARLALASGARAAVINAALLVVVLAMRALRVVTSRQTPLEFEDVLPAEISPLRLNAD